MDRCVFGPDDCMSGLPRSPLGSPGCPTCLAAYARDIRALVVDYDDLAEDLTRWHQRNDDEVRVPGKPGSKAPVVAHVSNLRDDIRWRLVVWAHALALHREVEPMRLTGVRPRWMVGAAADSLASNIHLLAMAPTLVGPFIGPDSPTIATSGPRGIVALSQLHERVRTQLGQSRLVVHLPGSCAQCSCWALRRIAGTDEVWCAICHVTWPYSEYQRWAELVLAGSSPLDPPVAHSGGAVHS